MCTLFVSTVATVATLGWEFAMHNNYHSNIRRRFHKVVNDTQVREPLGFALLMMSEVCRMAAFVATLVRAGRASLASLRCSSQEDIQGTFKAFPQTPTFASWHVVTCCDTMIHQRLLEALAVGSVQSSALLVRNPSSNDSPTYFGLCPGMFLGIISQWFSMHIMYSVMLDKTRMYQNTLWIFKT